MGAAMRESMTMERFTRIGEGSLKVGLEKEKPDVMTHAQHRGVEGDGRVSEVYRRVL